MEYYKRIRTLRELQRANANKATELTDKSKVHKKLKE